MGNFKEEIGKKLQAQRKICGFKTQADLAAKIPGVDRTRISRWESGENLPDPIYRERLTALLSLPEGFFEETSSIKTDELSLIVAIQTGLPTLNEEQLETVLSFVNNIQAATRTDSAKIAKE